MQSQVAYTFHARPSYSSANTLPPRSSFATHGAQRAQAGGWRRRRKPGISAGAGLLAEGAVAARGGSWRQRWAGLYGLDDDRGERGED